jgi:radical SAM/Cys-rich protein
MNTMDQLGIIDSIPFSFRDAITQCTPLRPSSLKTFQINVGRVCNQTCRHCHVDASPTRTEMMSQETMECCLSAISLAPGVDTIDITGGAPEMNPGFSFLVKESRSLKKHVIDRCNLTILEEPGYEWLAPFLRDHQVEIVASLPHFSELNTDKQRGRGVFSKSIRALIKLNEMGYGTELPLNLVYNPNGFFLCSSQEQLEKEFKEGLESKYGIRFNSLYCINNMPISRFLNSLVARGKFQDYMETLANAFNPGTLNGLMCRSQISVGYDGWIYDCDFNQMLGLKAKPYMHIAHFDLPSFLAREIVIGNHCYGCTAGAGSSCGGSLID